MDSTTVCTIANLITLEDSNIQTLVKGIRKWSLILLEQLSIFKYWVLFSSDINHLFIPSSLLISLNLLLLMQNLIYNPFIFGVSLHCVGIESQQSKR